MFIRRDISNGAPPEPRTRLTNNPTLLFSWWCTCFSLVIILLRLGGRYVRIERLFREDKVMALSIIPLLARMACIHVVLISGTNNVNTVGRTVTEAEIEGRMLGSKLVLAARIFYAMFVWTAKFTVSEFLKRLTERFWKKNYDVVLRCIRGFLGVTFICVVIATLSECHPFDHYWQIVPDPGPRCRQGYAHLVVMGVTDMMTDILIVVFPIPIILRSAMAPKRKFDLVILFSMSVILIGITAARIPMVIDHLGRQQYRTVFASGEILAATAVSNAVIIGSFLRDRGVKKIKKYKFGSVTDSVERTASIARPPISAHHWGSDEDLTRDMGIRLDPSLHANRNTGPRPAPMGMPAVPEGEAGFIKDGWTFRNKDDILRDSEESDLQIMTTDPNPSPTDIRGVTKRSMSFFDVGGLLEDSSLRSSTIIPSPTSTTSAQDWATMPRRGSRALLHDLGGLLAHSNGNGHGGAPLRNPRSSLSAGQSYELSSRMPDTANRTAPLPRVESNSRPESTDTTPTLRDVGGLLDEGTLLSQRRPPMTSGSSMTAVNPPSPTSNPRSSFPIFGKADRDSTSSLNDTRGSLSEGKPP